MRNFTKYLIIIIFINFHVHVNDALYSIQDNQVFLQNDNNILDLIVPGNSYLTAGDIISFHLPLLRPVGDGEKQQLNPHHSGRYLITSIKHNINAEMGQYEMSLKCSKDAVKDGYMAERDTYQIDAEEKIAYDIYEEDQRILSTMKVDPLDYT